MAEGRPRTIVAHMWTGALILRRLGPADPDPTQEQLDALADAHTAANEGVRPDVRVSEVSPAGRARVNVGGASGMPGTPAGVLFPRQRSW